MFYISFFKKNLFVFLILFLILYTYSQGVMHALIFVVWPATGQTRVSNLVVTSFTSLEWRYLKSSP